MADESEGRLFWALKTAEMEHKGADKCVPFRTPPGSYWGLACHSHHM